MYRSISQGHEPTDNLLIEQAYAGNQAAFEMLVHRYQHLLYRFAKSHLGSDLAYDVVQYVLLQLHLSLPKLLGHQHSTWHEMSLKPWLFRVAWNRCIDERRRERKYPVFFSELEYNDEENDSPILSAVIDTGLLPEEVVERYEELDTLHEAIKALPPKYRDIVWLRYTEELSFNDIGQRLNMHPATAKTYFHRARLLLRTTLSLQLERTTIRVKNR